MILLPGYAGLFPFPHPRTELSYFAKRLGEKLLRDHLHPTLAIIRYINGSGYKLGKSIEVLNHVNGCFVIYNR